MGPVRLITLCLCMSDKGACLSWENVTYSVEEGSRDKIRRWIPFCRSSVVPRKRILHGLSGSARPGQLIAVMGSSGAGKTTLLNALAMQLNGEMGGQVLINGKSMKKSLFRRYCGYVYQDDVLLPNLSVRETLEFYADLRLPSSMPRKEKSQRVEETLRKLGLLHCQDVSIGGSHQRGISGGEKRRVSIAIELILNPCESIPRSGSSLIVETAIICLDEPTSGLDASTSLSVIESLADLAHNFGHTIICTIHQPRNQVFSLFDRLLLLAVSVPRV